MNLKNYTGIRTWIDCKNDGMTALVGRRSEMDLRIRQRPLNRRQGWNTLEWLIRFQHRDVEIGARKTFHSVRRTDLKLQLNDSNAPMGDICLLPVTPF